ncbi:MAG TPA: hypothetical protein VHW23_36235 [Kofleriaceae bacterium]|nr:hypothetical protein [Kofleriaceae bacterium]
MRRIHLVITCGILALGRSAAAQSCDAGALRAELEQEGVRVDHWNLAWRIVYTAAAAGQFGVAASGVADHDNTRSLWVGGGEAAISALGFWLAPLRIEVPVATGDACTDRAALRAAAERAAADERNAFWTNHIGGLLINLAGSAILVETASWKTAALSFATGYPVGLLTTYTMPRASWGRVREPAWTVSVVAGDRRHALVVAGAF